MSEIVPPRGTSTYAARTFGKGFNDPTGGWASMTMNFVSAPYNPGADASDDAGEAGIPPDAYDASAYQGIVFWARRAEGAQPTMRVTLATLQTIPKGGICKICYDSFGKNIALSTDWTFYRIAFSDLRQRGFGDRVESFDAEHVFIVSFDFVGPAAFDLWVDDLAFYYR